MIGQDRQGHMGDSRELVMSSGNLHTCVKDTYLEVDKYQVFEVKHGLLGNEAQVDNDRLYGKKIGWLQWDYCFSVFAMFCVLGILRHRTYGITPLQNGVIEIVN